MRVLFVSHVPVAHGAGGSLLTLAVALQQRGGTPLVVVPAAGALAQALTEKGIATTEIDCPWWVVDPGSSLKSRQWYLRRAIQAARALAPVIRQFKPDLVHTNSAVIPSGALAARITGVQHIWHLREQVVEDYDQRFILGRGVSLFMMGLLSRRLIAISRSVAQAYTAGTTERQVRVVYNGLELPPEEHSDSGVNAGANRQDAGPKLVLSGTLHPAKGQDEALRAVATLRRWGRLVHLTLIGADAVGYRRNLEALAEELGVTCHVTFAGFLSKPLPEIAAADIALVCSRCEGFGRATVEAMLLARPVVAANTCGTLEIVEDGYTGLLYRHGDPADLASKILELLDDPSLARRIGAAAYAVARSRFSIDSYVSSVLDVYAEALASRST